MFSGEYTHSMALTVSITKPSWFASQWNVEHKGKNIGSLRMIKKMSYMLAEAETSEGIFQVGYTGFSTKNLFLHDASGESIASFESLSFWKSDMRMVLDGKEYLWKSCNWWGSSFALLSADDEKELMRFQHALWKGHLTVEVHARTMSAYNVLLLLVGLYCMKLYEMQSASAASMVTVGVVVAS